MRQVCPLRRFTNTRFSLCGLSSLSFQDGEQQPRRGRSQFLYGRNTISNDLCILKTCAVRRGRGTRFPPAGATGGGAPETGAHSAARGAPRPTAALSACPATPASPAAAPAMPARGPAPAPQRAAPSAPKTSGAGGCRRLPRLPQCALAQPPAVALLQLCRRLRGLPRTQRASGLAAAAAAGCDWAGLALCCCSGPPLLNGRHCRGCVQRRRWAAP